MVDQQTLIQGVAKYFLKKVYGPDGMPLGDPLRRPGGTERTDRAGDVSIHGRSGLARQARSVPSEAEACSGCGGGVEPVDDTEPRAVLTRVGTAHWEEPKRSCPKSGRLFFPQSQALGIDCGHYSPAVYEMVIYAGMKHPSFRQGREALAKMAGLTIRRSKSTHHQADRSGASDRAGS